ncbi:hypothetical protein [Azonexus sp.]|uniref:hypothetical protein n=1 Tax=Azonexus sp. TaxID=1872668 RepID=UPI0027BA2782|nr:hypothetical protein [Azonexus sp.]
MSRLKTAAPVFSDRGTRVALVFALTAERLSVFYEHNKPLTEAQGAALAADWLSRSQRTLPLDERRHLSALSEAMASQITRTLSREAGLFTAHEMMESLDPNYHSELAQSLMLECERLLDDAAEGLPTDSPGRG